MLTSSDDYQRLHMHRAVCDLDSVRDQADGEPQRVAGAARGAGVERFGSSISVMVIIRRRKVNDELGLD